VYTYTVVLQLLPHRVHNTGTRAHTGTVSHDGRPIIQFAGARKPEIKSLNARIVRKLFKSFPIALLRYHII